MKKSLLALLFAVALVVPALAENMWIGGSIGYENNSPKNGDSVTSFSFEPEFGYRINNTWHVGLDFGYTYNEGGSLRLVKVENDKVTTLAILPFVRYKMFGIGRFSFLAKASVFYSNSKADEADLTVNSYGISIAPILSYRINDTWVIACRLSFAELNLQNSKCDDLDAEETRFGFNLNNGSIMRVCFSYNF